MCTFEDVVGYYKTAVRADVSKAGKTFESVRDPLPEEIRKSLLKLRSKPTKKAGTQSNQRSCAATAWILQNHERKFSSAHMAWTGKETWYVRSQVLHC